MLIVSNDVVIMYILTSEPKLVYVCATSCHAIKPVKEFIASASSPLPSSKNLSSHHCIRMLLFNPLRSIRSCGIWMFDPMRYETQWLWSIICIGNSTVGGWRRISARGKSNNKQNIEEIECKTHVPFLCVVCMTKTEKLMRSRFLIILSESYKTLIGTAYIMLCNISLALYENYNWKS